MNDLVILPSPTLPAIVTAAGDKARLRLLEFFALQIRNPHTRRAYARAAGEFLAWCEARGVASIAAVKPMHVGGYVEELTRARSAPTAKLRLAAIRNLFDWLVMGHVVEANPASSVPGPKHVVRVGKTPVLDPQEARQLIDTIDVPTPIGLRDRALIGLMVYSFAGVGAALAMKVEDVYVQNRRLWVRLHEKGGKHHAMRAAAAEIATKIGNHTFRATGITAYLKNGGTLEKAAAMANHASTQTTQLYDRRRDELSLDEVERVVI
jgi:integrase/recombinase XerC